MHGAFFLFFLFVLVPVMSMLFSQLRLSSLPFSKRWAPKSAFSSIESLPVLNALGIEYSQKRAFNNSSDDLKRILDTNASKFTFHSIVVWFCRMSYITAYTVFVYCNCYININMFWLWCSYLLKGPFLLADLMLRWEWVAGDGSRHCRSKGVLVRFGILDWLIFCWGREGKKKCAVWIINAGV